MRTRRLLTALGLVVALVGGCAMSAGALAESPRSAGGPAPAACERLVRRAAEVPGIRARIRARVEALEARLRAITDPRRRARVTARVHPRLVGLRALDDRLVALAAEVERRCPRVA